MKILAIETSTQACSAALLDGTSENFSCLERFEIAPRQHTQLILPMIDSVLNEAGYDIRHMDALAFGRGPGAFTGVRVATGVIQAISYGADLPVAQISSLAALAQGFNRVQGDQSRIATEKILVANDARMDEIYFAAYELKSGFMTLCGGEQVIKPERLDAVLQQPEQPVRLDNSWYALGNGWSEYAQQLNTVSSRCCSTVQSDEPFELPHARDIGYLAFQEVANETLVGAEQVSPVYLRDNVAKKPATK